MDDNKGLAYFVLGLGVGVAVGMIFAPVSGSEARGAIRNKAQESSDFLRRRSEEFRDTATDAVHKGKEMMSRQRDQLSAAVDAGKQAYREAISTATSRGPQTIPGGESM
jgi:gas vesicle protein